MSMDELMNLLDEMARDESAGADRFRAIKLLASQERSEITLPKPLSEEEWVERVARIMRGSGREITKRAWRVAFPNGKIPIHVPRRIKPADLTPEETAIVDKCYGLKQLYRHFPHIKRSGVPNGFPFRGREAQKEWCQGEAVKMLLERRQQQENAIAAEEAKEDAETTGTATNP